MSRVRNSVTGAMTDVSTPLTPFEGQGVWLNDKKEGWVAAVVTEIAGLEIKLKLYSGEEVYVPSHAYESLGADEDGLGLDDAEEDGDELPAVGMKRGR